MRLPIAGIPWAVFATVLPLLAACRTEVVSVGIPVAAVDADLRVQVDGMVVLDGSASRVQGRDDARLEYAWAVVSRPAGAEGPLIDAPAEPRTRMHAPVPGLYVVRLVVAWEGRRSAPAFLNVEAWEGGSTADLAASAIEATPARVLADAVDTVLLTVHLVDTSGAPLPERDVAFTLSPPTAGTFASPVEDRADGTYVTRLRAPGRASVATVGFTVDGRSAPETVVVEFTNAVPIVDAGRDLTARPWDAVALSASATDPNPADALAYRWRIVSRPVGAQGGLGAPTSPAEEASGKEVVLRPDEPGFWQLEVVADDGHGQAFDRVHVEVKAFEPLFYDAVTPGDTRALAVDEATGRVYAATHGREVQVYRPGASPAVVVAGCLPYANVADVAVSEGGAVWVAYEDAPVVSRLTTLATGACNAREYDPRTVMDGTPTAGLALALVGENLYLATDRDLAIWSAAQGDFVVERGLDALGADARIAAMTVDGVGHLWLASGEPRPVDGIFRTGTDIEPSAARIDLLPGEDDRARAVFPGAGSELWIGGAGTGVFRIADAGSATIAAEAVRFTISAGLPAGLDDDVRRGALDPASGDVWIATRTGVARYVRDANLFLPMTMGSLGLPAASEAWDVAFDAEGTAYVATTKGVYRVAR